MPDRNAAFVGGRVRHRPGDAAPPRVPRGGGSILATDLNEPMLAYGRSQIPDTAGLAWRQADALALPVPDGSFDAVVCGFGLLLFSDKVAAIREAFRVLRPDAAIGLIEGNPIGLGIVERRADAVPEIERAVAARIAVQVGDHPVRAPLSAVVFSARRP